MRTGHIRPPALAQVHGESAEELKRQRTALRKKCDYATKLSDQYKTNTLGGTVFTFAGYRRVIVASQRLNMDKMERRIELAKRNVDADAFPLFTFVPNSSKIPLIANVRRA